MGLAAVEDVGPSDAALDGVDAGADLRDHPLPDLAGVEECGEAGHVDPGDDGVRVGDVAVDAVDVGEVDELLGGERLGDSAGGGVGVHVVGLAFLVDTDGGDDGDEVFVQDAFEDRGFDVADVADEPETGVALLDRDETAVLAGEADGVRAVTVQGGDDVTVDVADQGHADDVDGLGVGDAQPLDELGFFAEAPHEVGDLGAAAVHDDGVHADEAHEDDVLGEEVGEAGLFHRVAAVLDHDGGAGELADVREGLGENGRLRGGVEGAFVDHDVPMFSST